MNEEDKILVGKVIGLHGLLGELKVKVLTDFPERFSKGNKIEVAWKEEVKESQLVSVEHVRANKQHLLIRIKGVENRNDASYYQGAFFMIDKKDVMPLPEDTHYIFQIIGLDAYYLDGEYIGKVSDVINTPMHDVYLITGEKEHLIPALKKVVKKIDMDSASMWIDREMMVYLED